MTNKKLIEKLLKHGYAETLPNNYGKKIGSITVIVHVCPFETARENPEEYFPPYFEEFTPWGLDTYRAYSANCINLALSKRKYF